MVRVALQSAVQGACVETAEAIVEEAQYSIRAMPKHGRTYPRPHVGEGAEGGTYTASAPGEPPANVSGDLADSIAWEPTGEGAEVTADNFIAHTMEFGSAGGKIAPRPFLHPAADSQSEEHIARVIKAVRSVTG